MQASMDTSPGPRVSVVIPQPQSFPSSPNNGGSTTKRPFHQVDDTAAETAAVAVTGTENQENNDPSSSSVKVSAEVAGDNNNTTTTTTTNTTTTGTAAAVTAAAKKRKLSPASKEAKQREKEEKERQRLEEKAKREEERRVKEEEKKKRDAEREEERRRREEKKKLKEEEKAAREEEKRKKEEEKVKKERSQMRLNAFFAKPAAQSAGPSSAASPKKNASAGDDAGSNVSSSHDSSKATTASDYQREFPDFFLQSYTKLAPMHRFQRDSEALRHVREKVDSCLKLEDRSLHQEPAIFRPSELFHMMPYKRRRGKQIPIKEVLLKVQNQDQDSSANIGEISSAKTATKLQDLLRKVTMKSLKFGEDVRPPYQGTFTRPVSESTANKLSRNPFRRALPDTNYDYDSEAEWEEPEEGEDLDSEEEEETSDEGDDDMEGFLDDEDDHPVNEKRRMIVGDLEPVCSSLCWQEDGPNPELQPYKIETISDSVAFPIDPFSTAYWQKPKLDQGPPKGFSTLHAFAVTSSAQTSKAAAAAAAPGVSNNNNLSDGAVLAFHATGKAKRPFPPEQLSEFKQVVEGSDLTKAGLIEILKKRFPKVSKDVLKDTLNNIAVRMGQKEAEKKWVCR